MKLAINITMTEISKCVYRGGAFKRNRLLYVIYVIDTVKLQYLTEHDWLRIIDVIFLNILGIYFIENVRAC